MNKLPAALCFTNVQIYALYAWYLLSEAKQLAPRSEKTMNHHFKDLSLGLIS